MSSIVLCKRAMNQSDSRQLEEWCGGTQREEDRERVPGTKVASRERLAKQIWGDQGGTWVSRSLWVGAWTVCFYC